MERPVLLKFPSIIKPSLQISRFSIVAASQSSSSSSSSSSSAAAASEPQQSPFIVDYLIEELGFSKERALKASKRLIHIKTSKKPDSVLEFLRSIGLSQSQVFNTILRRPLILTSNVKKNLVPRIELLKSLGASDEELPELVVSSAFCFGNSINHRLIPAIDFLRGILKDDRKVRDALKRCPWILTNDPQKVPLRNLEFLRNKGMNQSSISLLVYKSPIVLVYEFEKLNLACKTVEEMGFNSKDASFVDVLHLVIVSSKENISRKMEIMSSFGFEKSSIYSMKRLPFFFRSKDESMKKKLDFFINEVGLDHETLLKNSFQLSFSLEGRLIPWYKWIRSLQSKGLIPNEVDFSKAFVMSKENFYNEYVNKFKDVNGSDLLEAHEECQDSRGIEELSLEDEESQDSGGKDRGVIT